MRTGKARSSDYTPHTVNASEPTFVILPTSQSAGSAPSGERATAKTADSIGCTCTGQNVELHTPSPSGKSAAADPKVGNGPNAKARHQSPNNGTTGFPKASKPAWNNEGDNVEDYTSPPVIDWTDQLVCEEFQKEPFCKLDLAKSCVNSDEVLQLKRLIIQYRCIFEPQRSKTCHANYYTLTHPFHS